MSAERIDLLQFRIRFLEHLKLDIAVRSTQVHLIKAVEGHVGERYERFGRECQTFPRHNVVVTLPLFAAISLDPKTNVGPL